MESLPAPWTPSLGQFPDGFFLLGFPRLLELGDQFTIALGKVATLLGPLFQAKFFPQVVFLVHRHPSWRWVKGEGSSANLFPVAGILPPSGGDNLFLRSRISRR